MDEQKWLIAGNRPVTLPRTLLPYEKFREAGFVGAKVIGSANVVKFLNAFFALAPWDVMKDPDYFDRFLLAPDQKPKKLIYRQL